MFRIGTKISRRFLVAIMLIAVIPISIMGYQTYVLAKRTLMKLAYSQVSTIVENHANHLDLWLQERLNDIGVLSRLPAIQEACLKYSEIMDSGASTEEKSSLLYDTLAIIEGRSPSYESIRILLPDGTLMAGTHPNLKSGVESRDQPLLEKLKGSDKPIFGSPYEVEGGRWQVHLAAAIKNHDGKELGNIVAVLDLSRTIDPIMTHRIGLGETGETYLVNRERRIITESRFLGRAETSNQPFESLAIEMVLQGKEGTAIYPNYLGKEVLGSYMWQPQYEWGILTEVGTGEIMEPLTSIKMVGIGTALVVSAVCFLMARIVSRNVSRPIVEVATAAQCMAGGDLDQRIPFSGKDELGILAASFNAMAQQLSQSVTSLRRKEESLRTAYDKLVATREQLVQSEKMAAIGELVASIAHEMRNPLSSVKLNLQIIGRSIEGNGPLFEHHQIAIDQVLQLERMFSDLLNYSKPLTLEKREVLLGEVIQRSLAQLETECIARGIQVGLDVQEATIPISLDSHKMEQVFVNLLKNAIEATEDGGRIEVTARLDRAGEKRSVTAWIRDQGPGISQRNLKTIFQPFFTTKKKGTGLGLCIVKKIMDAHGGEISISCPPDKGTEVQLVLPVSERIS